MLQHRTGERQGGAIALSDRSVTDCCEKLPRGGGLPRTTVPCQTHAPAAFIAVRPRLVVGEAGDE